MIKVFSTFTEELDKDQIFSICQLKNIRWKFGIKSLLVRFDTNVKKKRYQYFALPRKQYNRIYFF